MTSKKTASNSVSFRLARIKDIPRMAQIEELCFSSDRLSRRSFHRLIKNGNAEFWCLIVDKMIAGYGLLFYRRGTSLARIYSLAIDPHFRGMGLSKKLLTQLEKAAAKELKSAIRLEVRADNNIAIALYESIGYKRFKVKLDYYEDHTKAWCYEKRLYKPKGHFKLEVPFYPQKTDFTCGPAALLMAMAALKSDTPLTQSHELDIWREATTIFMLSGHGGCGPRGLALAAWRRGFKAEIYLNRRDELFLNSVRSQKKKEIIKLVHQDFKNKIEMAKIKTHYSAVSLKKIQEQLEKGIIPLILISSYQITQTKTPHWVVVSGLDENYVYLHDPDDIDVETSGLEQSAANFYDGAYLPVARKKFLDMAKWGSQKLMAVIFISKRRSKK